MSLLTNLVSYWKLDGNSNDAVGSNNGTDTAITYGTSYGKINQGSLFNGSGYISMGNVLGYDYNQTFTIGAWIKHSMTTSINIISKQQNSGGYLGYGLGTASGGYFQFFLYNDSGTTQALTINANANNNDGIWHYVTCTYDGSNTIGGLTIYVDGSNAAVTTVQNVPFSATITSTTAFQISGRGGAVNLFSGDVDEVGIWSRALTSTEVSQLYNGGAGLQYPFTQNSGFLPFFIN